MTTTHPADHVDTEALPRHGGHSVGTWASGLFVTALAVFHGSLLFSYFMIRHEAPRWPPEGYSDPPMTFMVLSTGAVLASTIPLIFGYLAIQRDNVTALVLGLTTTLTLGWTFFFLQTVGFARLDLQPVDTVYSALVVVLYSYQLLVTLLALLMGGMMVFRTYLGHFSSQRYLAIETLLIMWGFVTVSWLLSAATIYLTPHIF